MFIYSNVIKYLMKKGGLSQADVEKNSTNSLRENIDVISFGNIISSMFSKRSLSLVLMFIMAVNVFALPVLASNNVAYIFKNKARIDDNVIEVFEGKGLNVDLINEKDLPSDFSAYRFVYLGDERFRNDMDIKIWNYPTIVSNYFYGEEWGLTDRDGISQLVSSAPLSVKIGHRIVEVYTQGTIGGIGIPYYYLDGENKADDLLSRAVTYTTKNNLVGDVVSFGAAGITLANGEIAQHNICFYGIVESDYWTNGAVELLEECVDFVGVTCESNNDCSDEDLGGPYCVGDQIFQNVNDFSCINAGTVDSQCVSTPDQFLVESCSASCSQGACVCLDNDNDGFDECAFGTEGDDGNNLDCNDGNVNINPGLSEMCGDNLDNNCNGSIDEGCPSDLDNDGFDNANPGSLGDDGLPIDCRDDIFAINPDATEICDFVDNNCNGQIDENCSVDLDEDDYDNTNPGSPGDDGRPIDCNDNDNTVHPNAFEICDGKDNDCDGSIDESDGDCNNGEVCSLGSCSAVTCDSDNDCGVDGFFDGRFCTQDDVFQNYIEYTCENPGTISSSCSQDVDSRKITDCTDSCQAGSCISIGCNNDNDCNDGDVSTVDNCVNPGSIDSYCVNEVIECVNNSDCNDNDSYTVDTCLNPGTINSMCDHEDTVCLLDADCGIDGFVNGLSCTGDDVSQDYRSYECENGGTISASCSQVIEERVVTECSDSCSEGSCVTVTCNNDNDCSDGDSETTDVCLNPGTVNSMCTHEDVLCSLESDCGTDRYTGQLFCEGKSIFRNFVDNSCNVPGTQASFCSNSVDAVEVYECTYACNSGSCIRCNTQNDCSDGNDGTVDICRFGGTIDSYCSHDVVSCFNDSECGEDSFTGTPFCIGEDVYQNFRDLSCTNAGTSGSFCDIETENQLVESCELGCSQGSCNVETECNNLVNGVDFDDDNDGLANELDPGCWDDLTQPSTYNPELDDESRADVTCYVASDCGFIDYLYPPFCENNQVIDRQDIYVCNNPGTGISSCNIESVTNIDETCSASEVCFVDQCVNDCVDLDNDSYDSCPVGLPDDDGLPIDCNDNMNAINPGATEICDGIDNDCNGLIDESSDDSCQEGSVCSLGSCTVVICENDNDCDDNDDYTADTCNNPGTVDSFCTYEDIICVSDGDCVVVQGGESYCSGNDVVFDQLVPICLNSGTTSSECSSDTFQVLVDECSNTQICLVDQCVDDCMDIDGDGFDDCSVGEPDDDGEDLDCDDNEFTVNPGASEMCNGIDDDCDGEIDEGADDSCDSGSICSLGSCIAECMDVDLDGFDTCNPGEDGDDGEDLDCNDDLAAVNPGAIEICDGIDNNCDGSIDEGSSIDLCGASMICDDGMCFDVACDMDLDCGIDGFTGNNFCSDEDTVVRSYQTFSCSNPGTSISSCTSFTEARVVDECEENSLCSQGSCLSQCVDLDNDGFDTCDAGEGDDGNPIDCNDDDLNINPNALEICDGIDNNCDGLIDEVMDASSYHLDVVSDPSTKISLINGFIANNIPSNVAPGGGIDGNWVPHFDGAHWLFFARGGGFYNFEKTFIVPSLDVSDLNSQIRIAADNLYEVRLNGQVVGQRNNPAYGSSIVHSLDNALVSGENTLRVRVDNLHDGSGGGLIYSIDIDGETTSVCIPEEVCDPNPFIFGGDHGRVLRNYVDNQGFDITNGDEGYLDYSDINANVVCELLGYDRLVSKHDPRRLSSPSDNTLAVWNGNDFNILQATSSFRDRLDTVTCVNVC